MSNSISNLQGVITGTDAAIFTNAGFCGRVSDSITMIGNFIKAQARATTAIKEQTDVVAAAAQNAAAVVAEQTSTLNYYSAQQDIVLQDVTKNLDVELQYVEELATNAFNRMPSAPLSLVTVAGRNRVALAWLPPTDPGYPLVPLTYSISYKLTSSSMSIPIMQYDPSMNGYNPPPTNTIFFIPPKAITNGRLLTFIYGLTNDVTYRFSVTASGSAGSSQPSTDSPFVTPKRNTPAPTNLVIYPGNKSVLLNFTPPTILYDSIAYHIVATHKTTPELNVVTSFKTKLRMDSYVDMSPIYTSMNSFPSLTSSVLPSTYNYSTNSFLLNNLENHSAYLVSIYAVGYDLEPFNPYAGDTQMYPSEAIFTMNPIVPTDIPTAVGFLSSNRIVTDLGTSILLSFQSPEYASLSPTNPYSVSIYGPNNDLIKVTSISGFYPATNPNPRTSQRINIPPPATPLQKGSYKCFVQGANDNPTGGEPILGELSQPTVIEI